MQRGQHLFWAGHWIRLAAEHSIMFWLAVQIEKLKVPTENEMYVKVNKVERES